MSPWSHARDPRYGGTQAAAGILPPDFSANQAAWIAVSNDYIPLPGGPKPVTYDLAHPYVGNNAGPQPTFRVADLTNPNVKAWAKALMKKENERVLAGEVAYTPRSSCMPAGVPSFMLFIVNPVFIIQTPRKVLFISSGNQEVRHIYLDVPHSAKPKPSWYGKSIGHYEGDTLVIDTIGFNDRTFVEQLPHPSYREASRYGALEDDRRGQDA